MKTIELSIETFSRLEKHAQGFDTPANVIEKLLNHYEQVDTESSSSVIDTSVKKDTTKYMFNNFMYGKGKLVLEVVKQYVNDHSNISLTELETAFPKHLQGSIGVFNLKSDVDERYVHQAKKRHYVEPHNIISCGNENIVVCTEWGIGNINEFITNATSKLGYSITAIKR